MRTLINSIAHMAGFTGILFTGADDRLAIDPINGLPFTTFERALERGPKVYECRVELRRPYRLSDLSDLHDIARIMRDGRHDGYILDDGDVREIVVFDADAIEVLDVHVAQCDLERVEEAERILAEYRPEDGQNIVLVTGQLAATGLRRVMEALAPDSFTYDIRPLDIAVAAWLTTDLIAEQIGDLEGVDLVLIPGKVMGDETDLEARLGVPVLRGPVCYSEMPTFLEYEGIEVEASGIVRPKIIVLGELGGYSEDLAATYEVPFIHTPDLVNDAIGDPDDFLGRKLLAHRQAGEPFLHNEMAELIRARLMLPDAKKGFVMVGYPLTLRDIQWLDDMKVVPDVIVQIGDEGNEVTDFYRSVPGFIQIAAANGATGRSVDDARSELFTRVETMLQSCVKPVSD